MVSFCCFCKVDYLVVNHVELHVMMQTKPENARVGETLQMHPLIANGGIGVPSGSDRSCRQFNKTEVCNEYVHKMGCTLVASQFYLFRMDLYCRALRRLERWWTKR
jgi:hypothetical protein